MALATQCPHCHTTFKVASDQLKLRGGIVRCGTCQRIFDGNAHLIDLAALAAKKASAAEAPAQAAPGLGAEVRPEVTPEVRPEVRPELAPDLAPEADAAADFDALPVYTLDLDHTLDPLGILPKLEAEAPPANAAPPPIAEQADPQAGDDLPPAPDGGAAAHTIEAEVPAPAPALADTQAHTDAHVDEDTHVDDDTHVDSDAHVDADPVPRAHMDADAVAHARADAHTDTDTDTDTDANADAHAQEDTRADVGTRTHAREDAHDADMDMVIDADAHEVAAPNAEPSQPPQPSPKQAPEPTTASESESESDTAPSAATEPPPAPPFPGRIEPHFMSPLALPSTVDTAPQSDAPPAPGFGPPPQADAHAHADSGTPERHAPLLPLPDADEARRAPAPASAYAPAGRIEPSFGLPVDEELVAHALPDDAAEPAFEAPHAAEPTPRPPAQPADADGIPSAALPLRASADADPLAQPAYPEPHAPGSKSARAKAVEARSRRSRLTPTRIEPPRLRVPADVESDEPEFVKRSRRQEQSGKTVRILMAAGAAILLLVLAAQLVLNFRNELAARYPGARPALAAACGLIGCRVGWPAQAENLIIDDGELAPIGPDAYSLNTALHNQGNLTLAWPSIELELTDASNKPVLRRVFGPGDYLAPGTQAAAGFGARSEQPVRLNFALSGLKPSGYHIFVFYP